jgi:hypothetical protein
VCRPAENAQEGADDRTRGKKITKRRNQRASYKGKKEDLKSHAEV